MLISTDSNLAIIPDYISTYHKNIIFIKVNFSRLIAKTWIAKLWESGVITGTGFYHNNMSNVLRIVLLLKFGGVYLDSDVISVKPVPQTQNGQQGCSVFKVSDYFSVKYHSRRLNMLFYV